MKWPNDVLANGGKIAGLLMESEAQGQALVIVIGFGVNVASAPEGLAFPANSLRGLGHRVTVDEVFSGLTDAWVAGADLWDHGLGFNAVRNDWLAQAAGIGQAISVRMGERVDRGIFETLDEQGRLILRKKDGMIHVVSAGDVFFGDAAGGATT